MSNRTEEECELEELYFEILLVAIRHEPKFNIELIDGSFMALAVDMPAEAHDALLTAVFTQCDWIRIYEIGDATGEYDDHLAFGFQITEEGSRNAILDALIDRKNEGIAI